jgi:diaminopimelate epimerase
MVMVDSELDSGLCANTDNSTLGFCKMQALGNDFVVVAEQDLRNAVKACAVGKAEKIDELEAAALPELAKKLCSRHFGIGADGFIVVRRGSKPGRLSWTYLNSDGSSSQMCGNGLRCLALWAEEHGFAPSNEYFVETGKGPVQIKFISPASISTDLGEPILAPNLIPVRDAGESPIIAKAIDAGSNKIGITCVSMGNPHCVTFLDDLNAAWLESAASCLQADSYFPEGVNVEFVKVESRSHVKVVVYERGCGRTLACASGAAAVAVACVLEKKTERELTVELEGGPLQISWSEEDNHVRITGPAGTVFRGQVDLKSLLSEGCKC